MSDVSDFVGRYSQDSLHRIKYAGSIDPLDPVAQMDRDFLRKDDPNLPFRSEVIAFLFGSPSMAGRGAVSARDELVEDLFRAHWEFAVGHDCLGHEALATEILRRERYEAFVHAYTLSLGMDQSSSEPIQPIYEIGSS